MKKIHPSAIIASTVQLADNVDIGPYCVIEGNVTIGAGTRLGPFVHIQGNTTIGERCTVHAGASIGGLPQDLKFRGEKTYLKIGDDNDIREYVTMNLATGEGETTLVGNHNLLMAYAHVAHNCLIGDHCVIANSVALAGHIVVEDYAILGGMVGVHQFSKVGRHTIIGGCSKITKDIIPYVMADGHPAAPSGINRVGLKRRGFSDESIAQLDAAYKLLFRSGLNVSDAVREIGKLDKSDEVSHILEFIKNSSRGIAKES